MTNEAGLEFGTIADGTVSINKYRGFEMTQELLPCPFTGEKPSIIHRSYTDNMMSTVRCVYIASSVCEVGALTIDAASTLWNTRPILHETPEEKERRLCPPLSVLCQSPKMKRVDLDKFILTGSNDYCDGNNKAIDLIKAKYGDLYTLTKEGDNCA